MSESQTPQMIRSQSSNNAELPELGTHFQGKTSGGVVKVVGFLDLRNSPSNPQIALKNVHTKDGDIGSTVGGRFSVSLSRLKTTHCKVPHF